MALVRLGMSALMHAMENECCDIVVALLDAGASLGIKPIITLEQQLLNMIGNLA
jgi:hypothetical protein